MTEAEWNACTDPQPMLEFLSGKASDRKLRLFGVGFCRLEQRWLRSEHEQRLVDVAEEYSDGNVGSEILNSISQTSDPSGWTYALGMEIAATAALHIVFHAGYRIEYLVSKQTAKEARSQGYAGRTVGQMAGDAARQAAKAVVAVQCDLFRDIFGNPFRPITVDPAWFTPTARSLAQTIYDERAFDRLPILADALEEAGCMNQEILNHLRQPGVHVRGCWALDAVLGKE